jgi:hypothetical protein
VCESMNRGDWRIDVGDDPMGSGERRVGSVAGLKSGSLNGKSVDGR